MKKFTLTLVLFLFVLLQFFPLRPAYAAVKTYYVAKTGKDTNPGTASQPWLTIKKAANTVIAGDTVYVRGGTYAEKVLITRKGSAGNYITFSAYPGETVILDLSSISMSNFSEGGFALLSTSYIKIVGFTIKNSKEFGLLCYNSSYCTFQNNNTYNTYRSGIATWNSTNVTIDGNDVQLANNDGEGEMITVQNSQFVNVTNNKVHNGGPGSNGGEGIDVKNGSHDVLVQGNQVYDVPRVGIYVDAYEAHTYNVTVDRNIVHNSVRTGIAVASERGGELNNIYITNNLIYQNGRNGMGVGAWGHQGYSRPIHHVYVVNNTLFNNAIGGISVDDYAFTDIYIRNNIVSDNVRYSIAVEKPSQTVVVTHNLINGFRSTEFETRGTNYVEADPLFTNASTLNFSLLAASPAINAGTALNAPDHDFVGIPRPNGTAWDIGAYEFTTSTASIFSDVPSSHWANSWIERLYKFGVTSGCSTSPMLYCPDASATRAQMAIFILRSKHNTAGNSYTPPAATGKVFTDVPLGSFADAWIEQLFAEGITTGCGSGKYCPNANVTRAEMAIFLLRGKYGSAYTPPAVGTSTGFADVPITSFAAAWIKQLALEGITAGCGGGNYCPSNPVTRAEMAVFLVRTFGLP